MLRQQVQTVDLLSMEESVGAGQPIGNATALPADFDPATAVMVSKRRISRLTKQAADWEHLVQVTSRLPVRRRLFADGGPAKIRSTRIGGYVRSLLEKDATEKQRRFGFNFGVSSGGNDPSSPWEWEPLKQYSSSPPCELVAKRPSKSPLPRLEDYLLDPASVQPQVGSTKSSDCEHATIAQENDFTEPVQKLEQRAFCASSTHPVRGMSV